ncbi:kinase-like protein [Gigaspora margarita]|uniref:Kinase-like protein n=1 Tax=Gigaspora margarita TaxID=4874 RepID=A0A8H3X764_GIGMA|nr:kinase-like protein [Gigaspora margarita]
MFGKKTSSIFKKNDRNDESNWEDDTLIDQNKYANSHPQGVVTASLINRLDSMKIEEDRLKRIEEDLNGTDSRLDSRITALREKREKVINSTLQKVKLTRNVDLCYVLDCTASMDNYIEAAKNCILKVTNYMKRINPSISIHVGFCGYRDHCDGKDRIQYLNFTDSYEKFSDYIKNNVKATGGGDGPEDVLGGLDAAISQMSWSRATRVILHIGDAPPHGRQFTSMYDNYPEGDPNGLTAENVMKKMQSSKILYFFGKITNNTEKMLNVFRGIIGQFSEFDLKTSGNNPEELLTKFFYATCSAITSSVTLNSTTIMKDSSSIYSLQRKKLQINPQEPNWSTLLEQSGKLLSYKFPKKLSEVKDKKFFKGSNLTVNNMNFKVASQPFSIGAERYAYFGIDTQKSSTTEKLVMKKYHDTNKRDDPLERYLESAEVSSIAHFLANEFNSAAKRADIKKKVRFIYVKILRQSQTEQCYSVEGYFRDAEFKRFNVNSGVITEFHSTLEAFAHFTHSYTKGYLVVCDLQGIELENEFVLTDPAIHCVDSLRFGGTNLGEKGINECFLNNHTCNNVCKKLKLKS